MYQFLKKKKDTHHHTDWERDEKTTCEKTSSYFDMSLLPGDWQTQLYHCINSVFTETWQYLWAFHAQGSDKACKHHCL